MLNSFNNKKLDQMWFIFYKPVHYSVCLNLDWL